MTRALLLAIGIVTLAFLWLGPLPALASDRFSAHMTLHMGVVAIAAPLFAFALAGGPHDPAARYPGLFAALPASLLELAVVWTWHAPALHHLARSSTPWLVAEQLTFFASGLLLWLAAFGADAARGGTRAAAGVVALLLTSMHMTLLGALLGLSPRPLYAHGDASMALHEQHVGGAIMLLVGGSVYLAGGLWLSRALLERGRVRAEGRA